MEHGAFQSSLQRSRSGCDPPAPTTEDRSFFALRIGELADRLYGVALRFTRNGAAAEDLVSEAVVKAWAHLPQLEDRACFEKWIFRILANTFFSQCRHEREELLDADEDEDGFSLFDRLHQPFLLWWGNPEQELIHKLLCEDLDRALGELPDCYRAVVVSVDLLGHSYAEVAAMLGVPVGTVRSRLNRARSRLQRALWQQALAAGLVQGKSAEDNTHD
ncbi:sigma-70 family RNA polymerase sigma factor [Aromatoleum evansii]|uniref:Sigma-70 family RNA polymerase sigma factor n=1 Tax=Aromatoleum evansii TaxID=59406 RepID=A0ABZ1AVU3_AROEV|nr:sigma-70 family RNA polymerase sigma factor [Aromatoleum evansii]